MFENKKLLIGIGAGVFVVIISIVLIVASGKRNNNNNNTGNNIVDNGPGSVTIWTPIEDPSVYAPFKEQFQDLDETFTVVKKDPATYADDLVNAVASGGGPDIFLIRNDWLPKLYKMIAPEAKTTSRYSDSVTDFKALFPNLVSSEMINSKGSIFGVPLSSDPLVLYLNRDILENKLAELRKNNSLDDATEELLRNSPKTWDDFSKVVKLVTQKNGNDISIAGAALGTSNNIDNAQDILYLMMYQNGTTFLSSDGSSPAFHLPQRTQSGQVVYPGTKALDLYTSFSNPSSDVYTWNESMPNAATAFAQGKVAMLIGYSTTENYIKQVSPNLNYEVLPVPQIRQTLNPAGYMRYWAMTVNRNSKNQKLAWSVINTLLDKNRSSYLQATGRRAIALEDLGDDGIDSQTKVAKSVYKPDAAKYDSIMLNMIKSVTHDKQSSQLSIESAAKDISALFKK